MKKVAVLIKDVEQQYEGLRTSLGLLLEDAEVQMIVINNEIGNMDEAYHDNMEFLDEMEGERFSNNPANVDKYGFKYVTIADIAARINESDIVIPF
jgi:hypothetical protein